MCKYIGGKFDESWQLEQFASSIDIGVIHYLHIKELAKLKFCPLNSCFRKAACGYIDFGLASHGVHRMCVI